MSALNDPEVRAELEAIANGGAGAEVLPPPSAPMRVARKLIDAQHTHEDGTLRLRHWRGGWWQWKRSHWTEVENRAIDAAAYAFTEHATFEKKGKTGVEIVPWDPNRHKVGDLVDALAAVAHLGDQVDQPGWLNGAGHDGVIVACGNGLLDVASRELLVHHPNFFNQTAVPFDYDPAAPAPTRWLGFLEDLWGEDVESIAALQEWFGYVISGRLDLHKILLLVGPTRGGKGAIARVLGALVGRENVAGPTLSSLAGDFGLAPLIGCPLAVISDARMAGRGGNVVVERLLSISGEDLITVNIKYKEQWTGKLPSRFMVLSNELPELGDASMAIAGRFVALILNRSWLGHEDATLEPELHRELPGILNWSLDGLERLDEQGRFTAPAASEEAIVALRDLASPVAAFVRDRCVTGPDHEAPVDDVYAAWKDWAESNGHRGKTKQTLGRDLRAAVPRLRIERPGPRDDRTRVYAGIALKDEAS